MKSFDIQRFGRVLWRDLLENRTKNLRALASLYVANLAIIGFNFYEPSRNGFRGEFAELFEMKLMNMTTSCVNMCFWFLFLFSISQAFSNLRTKQLRISYLTLPATNAEKFLSRIVLSTVVYVIAFYAMFVAADLTRMLLFPLLGHSFNSLVPTMCDSIGHFWSQWPNADASRFDAEFTEAVPAVSPLWVKLCATFAGLWYYSCFLLGSAFFRKRAFLYTILVLLSLCVVLGVGADFAHNTLTISLTLSEKTVFPVIACTAAVLAVVNFWLSYRLFKRTQVIPRKLFRR